jgi:hypothetical protein
MRCAKAVSLLASLIRLFEGLRIPCNRAIKAHDRQFAVTNHVQRFITWSNRVAIGVLEFLGDLRRGGTIGVHNRQISFGLSYFREDNKSSVHRFRMCYLNFRSKC